MFEDDEEEDEEQKLKNQKVKISKNIGRDTPTSSGPNSFGKSKTHGFVAHNYNHV